MSKVKIILDKDESYEEVESDLRKSLNYIHSGEVHSSENFDDPAMVDVFQKMEKEHKEIYSDMLREISEALDKEYSG